MTGRRSKALGMTGRADRRPSRRAAALVHPHHRLHRHHAAVDLQPEVERAQAEEGLPAGVGDAGLEHDPRRLDPR